MYKKKEKKLHFMVLPFINSKAKIMKKNIDIYFQVESKVFASKNVYFALAFYINTVTMKISTAFFWVGVKNIGFS